ncbi:hypothetical protein NUSPORA_00691 [Nucleospora cyclopteri]
MIRHGVKEEILSGEDLAKTKEYFFIKEMPENTVEEIFQKYRRMASYNPDDYFAWNILKLFVLKHGQQLDYVDNDAYSKYVEILKNEKIDYERHVQSQGKITGIGIQNNCKSYAAWNHRLFIHKHLNKEIDYKLCQLLLKVSPRNFHCWNYTKLLGHQMPINLDNPSSLQIKNVVQMIFTQPEDSAVWNLFETAFFGKSAFYLKKAWNKVEIMFNDVFKGVIKYDSRKYEVKTAIKYYLINNTESENLDEQLKVTLDLDRIKLKEVKMPLFVENILQLDPKNIYGLRFKLKFTEKNREEIVKKLKELDPIRTIFYEREIYYKIFMIEESKNKIL